MEEEPKEKDYQFINEIIIPKKKNKWLVRLETLGVVIVMAVVFGFVARWVFLSSDSYLRELLGLEEEQQKINLNNVTPTKQAEITKMPSPFVTGEDSVTDGNNNLVNGQNSYLQMYEEIRQLSEELLDSIAIVEIIEESVGLFEEPYEIKTWTTGLIIADNGVDLLILTDVEKISEGSSITVHFGETKVDGRIYSTDKAYSLAMIAVDKEDIQKKELKQVKLAKFTEDDIVVGTPVIALGGPNGYKYSMEQGMVTSLGDTIFVTDGMLSYFTTDMIDYKNGNGFVFNLSGEVMGMITHAYEKEIQDGVCSVITLKDIKGVIEGLLNSWKHVMFGITGRDISEENELVSKILNGGGGVYVTKVENNSPAMKAGIKPGDIIYQVDKNRVEGIQDFNEILLKRTVGYVMWVDFIKQLENGYQKDRVTIKLEERK